MLRSLSFSLLIGCLFVGAPAAAQPAETLQAPATFLEYELGTQFTPHHRVVDYVRHVAEHSPRVAVEQYGTSYEGRPLLLATISTPDNLERRDAIRRANRQRTGLAPGTPQDQTAIAWLSYGVHGNESVSTEAAMKTLHALADPANERTGGWLQNTVVLLDPLLNPDGRERYVQWYKQTAGADINPRPEARTHHEPWPGGRSNHYYFDLNRDWAWATQQETRHRLDVYHEWMPHVHVDFHEMGADDPYYFAPAAEPFHEDLTDWQREFQFTIGENNAATFDDNGWLYFTEEVFDLFYPGYGDTWPLFNGAIGMTYEQGGSGRAGRALITADGDTLTLGERLAHHHTAGLSTIEATAQNHEAVVQEFADYYDTAQQNPPGDYAAYVVRRANNADRLAALAKHLDRQRIRYGYATESASTSGRSYRSGERESLQLREGDLVVPAAQPKARLAKVLFEPQTTIVDSITYDITAWGLPYAYGVDAYALSDAAGVDTSGTPPTASPSATGPDRPYAYVTPWGSRADVRFAASLLEEDVHLRFATEPFTVDGRSYDRGTLLITRANNTNRLSDFDATVRRLAEAHGQPVHGVSTGFTEEGPDFGSGTVGFVEGPHVAVLAGEPTVSSRLGEVWHYFDQQIDYPATLLPADDFEPAMLDDVDVLVLPDGYYGEWMSDDRASAITDWVRGGGRLLALGGASSTLASHAGYHLSSATDSASDDAPDASLPAYADRQRSALTRSTPGSIHRAWIDTTHPLGFGLSDPYFTLKRTDDAYAYLEDGWTVAALEEVAPVSGFMGHEAQQEIDDTLLYGTQPLGDGQVVYFVDNPLFRGFWYQGQVLFGNAVFFVGSE
jgi:hypothetical protein